MTTAQALLALAAPAAEALRSALGTYGIADVEAAEPDVADAGGAPFAALPVPGLATSAGLTGHDGGLVVLGLSARGARMLAAAMTGQDPAAVDAASELSELDRSALAEATGEVVAAAAAAVGDVLGTEVGIDAPQTRPLTAAEDARAAFGDGGPHAVATTLTVMGEPCVLVQIVPAALLAGLAGDLDEAPVAPPASDPVAPAAGDPMVLGGALRETKLRVWAEIGRARLPVGRVVGLPAGAVLELDQLAEDPVDIFVNGRRYATGRLVVDDAGEWAVRLESLLS